MAGSQPSSSKTKTQRSGPHKRKPTNLDSQVQALPGVQKIKAALRQTRRLLAKVRSRPCYIQLSYSTVFPRKNSPRMSELRRSDG